MRNQNAPLLQWVRKVSNRIQILPEPITQTDIVLMTFQHEIHRGTPLPRRFVCRIVLFAVPTIMGFACGGGKSGNPLEPTAPPKSNGTLSVSLSGSAATSLARDLALAASLVESGVLTTTSIEWKKISGPADVVFKQGNALVTAVNFTAYGVYVLRVTVKNGDLTSSADVTVTVSNPPNLSISTQIYEGRATVTDTLAAVIRQSPDIGAVKFNPTLPFVDTVRNRSAIVFAYRHPEIGNVVFETQNIHAVSLVAGQQYSAFTLTAAALALMEAQAALTGSQHFVLL